MARERVCNGGGLVSSTGDMVVSLVQSSECQSHRLHPGQHAFWAALLLLLNYVDSTVNLYSSTHKDLLEKPQNTSYVSQTFLRHQQGNTELLQDKLGTHFCGCQPVPRVSEGPGSISSSFNYQCLMGHN